MQERFAATATASAALALAAVIFAAAGARSCAAPRVSPRHEPAPAGAAPWTLTASDGSGLRLVRVDAKGVVEGPLAFTELHLYFHNPEARVREGTFAITLPPRATLSRFAMEHEGGFHEGEVVARSLARRAYEDFLHRRQDPALLERAAGNLFTARVFPIPAGGDKHLVISFVHELAGGAYVLPLHGLPAMPRIDVVVDAARLDGSRATRRLHERAWLPDRDFVVGTVGPAAVTAGSLVAAAVPIRAPSRAAAAADAPRALTLLVDTSASRALGFARYAGEVRDLVEALGARYGGQLELEVAAFDQEVHPIYNGPASGYGGAAHAALVERGAAGASDVGAAIAWLGRSAASHRRVAIVTDGVATAGAAAPVLAATLRGLGAEQRLERLDVVLAGGIRDEAFAAGLARAGLPRAGDVHDLDRGAGEVAAGLGEAVLVDVEIDVPGAVWVSPRRLPAVRAGGAPVMVYAVLAVPATAIDVIVGGERRTIELARGTQPLIERAIARAQIDALDVRLSGLPTGTAEAAALRQEIERRAVAARVVSSQTAMIVLETEQDYARYGIDRKGLAEILVVGPTGIETAGRPRIAGEDKHPRADGGEGQDEGGGLDARPDDGADTGSYKMQLDEGRADPQLSREEAIELARQAGILSARSLRRGFSSLTGTADLSSGFDDSNLYGSVRGRFGPDDRRPGLPPSDDPLEVSQEAGHAPAALTGRFAEVMQALAEGRRDRALALAKAWHAGAPGDLLAIVAVGEALEALGRAGEAARLYGSIIDLYPSRADLRRFAGERLERVAARTPAARALAIDTYRRAVVDRPDQLTGHRLLAYALLRAGDRAGAFAAILGGVDQGSINGRYRGIERVLSEDAGMIAAAHLAHGGDAGAIRRELERRSLQLATRPSTRFVLYWETDTNDVDLHVRDARGGHAYYSQPDLPSGGSLYADVTTGYGPECFAIPGNPTAGPYRVSVHYFAQGPMGFGMGLLQILRHDGAGGLSFEDRPYIVMNDRAQVDLGEVR